MSSMSRTVTGDVLVHHLKQDEQMIDADLLAERGRTARTLVREGPLRLTLMALAAGGDFPAHSTDGPVAISVVQGEVVFLAAGTEYPLQPGDVLVFAANVEHSARSLNGCVLLLTVVHTELQSGSHAGTGPTTRGQQPTPADLTGAPASDIVQK